MTEHPEDNLRPECAAVDDDLAELALGVLTGRQRSAALAHLETCARCSAEVDALAAAADRLLQLAPAMEPPIGFEARVFERLGLRERRASVRAWAIWRPRVAAALAACAAVVVLVVGALAGYGIGSRPAITGAYLASFVSKGHDVGQVLVYPGNPGSPTWLFMTVDDPRWEGAFKCEVALDKGPPVVLGQFWVSGGKGAWADGVDEPASQLRQARVVNLAGSVIAVAKL